MNVSFKSLIPVKIYFKDETDGYMQKEKELAKKHLPVMLADILQLDKKMPELTQYPLIRDKFYKYTTDYDIPKTYAKPNIQTTSSVTTVTVNGHRYLVTGEDIPFLKKIGKQFHNNVMSGMTRAQAGKERAIALLKRVKEPSSNPINLGIVIRARKVKKTGTHKNNYKFDNVEFWKLKQDSRN